VDKFNNVPDHFAKVEKSSLQGRRYGHPVIDIARELNRYLIPNVKYAGEHKEALKIKEKFRTMFEESLRRYQYDRKKH